MKPADGRLMQLDMTVRDSILATKSDDCLRAPWLPHKPDFLTDLPALDDLEPALQEL